MTRVAPRSFAPAPPSGEQFEIRSRDHRAVVTEVGATLRSYTVDGQDVIDGFPITESSGAGRGQVLAPWPNRLEDGTFTFEGRRGVAALDEPEHGNAIHGLVRWLPWHPIGSSADAVTLGCVVPEQPAFPWRIDLEVGYRVSHDGLEVTTLATNRSGSRAPFGIGFHPYLTVGTSLIDEAHLTIPAGRRLEANDRGLPVADAAVKGTDFDFTRSRAVGSTHLDTAFTELDAEAGRATVRLDSPGGSRSLELWMDDAFGYVMAYTGDTLEPVERRRRGIAIEPMTCPPNALRTGTDLIQLDPGSSWTSRWGIRA
jgi:aldose 1-epimerase